MSISKATAHWENSLKDGRGWMKPAHGSEVPFTLATRFQGASGSNPEEMIGAALAGCFSMALTGALGRAGMQSQNIETSADVHMEKEGDAFRIAKIDLVSTATVPGADAAKFQAIAIETKNACPVSKALTGTTITLVANLR